jgi:dienelactone hydrolase
VWLTACATAPAGHRFEMLAPGIVVGMPAEPGPFPVVIMLHGCGGRSAEGPLNRENAYREALVANGIAWLSVRSFPLEGRSFTSVCGRPPGTIGTDDRVEDLATVIDRLGRYPSLDGTRIGVLGFSMGATTAIKAAMGLDPTRAPGLRSAVALYGGCREIRARDGLPAQRRLLMMVGLMDTWTAAAPCIALATSLEERGHAAAVVVYPEATHQWDNPASTGGRYLLMGPGRGTTFVRYDPDTARDSVARAVAHFRATL